MPTSRFTRPRHPAGSGGANLNAIAPAPVLGMDRRTYIDTVCTYLREEVDHLASPVKTLADEAIAPLGTAKHWYGKTSAPDSFYMSRLRTRFPNFDGRMRELEGKQRDLAPDFEEALNAFFLICLRGDATGEAARKVYERFFKHHNEPARTETAAE